MREEVKRLSSRIRRIIAAAARLAAKTKRSRAERRRQYLIVYSRVHRVAQRRR